MKTTSALWHLLKCQVSEAISGAGVGDLCQSGGKGEKGYKRMNNPRSGAFRGWLALISAGVWRDIFLCEHCQSEGKGENDG